MTTWSADELHFEQYHSRMFCIEGMKYSRILDSTSIKCNLIETISARRMERSCHNAVILPVYSKLLYKAITAAKILDLT